MNMLPSIKNWPHSFHALRGNLPDVLHVDFQLLLQLLHVGNGELSRSRALKSTLKVWPYKSP